MAVQSVGFALAEALVPETLQFPQTQTYIQHVQAPAPPSLSLLKRNCYYICYDASSGGRKAERGWPYGDSQVQIVLGRVHTRRLVVPTFIFQNHKSVLLPVS